MSSILLIGTGRLAFHLGHAVVRSGAMVAGVAGRDPAKARSLAEALGCRAFPITGPLPKVDLRILAVSDDALASVSALLPVDGTPVIHLSGSKSVELLAPHAHRGVLWPVRSFSQGAPVDFKGIPVIVDADDPDTFDVVRALADHLSGSVVRLPHDKRQWLHLSAVIASNFPVFLLREAERLLTHQHIDPKLLHPLWAAAAGNALNGADQAVTGPARRGDVMTIGRQMELLAGEPELRRAYSALSDLILHTYHPETRDQQDL